MIYSSLNVKEISVVDPINSLQQFHCYEYTIIFGQILMVFNLKFLRGHFLIQYFSRAHFTY